MTVRGTGRGGTGPSAARARGDEPRRHRSPGPEASAKRAVRAPVNHEKVIEVPFVEGRLR